MPKKQGKAKKAAAAKVGANPDQKLPKMTQQELSHPTGGISAESLARPREERFQEALAAVKATNYKMLMLKDKNGKEVAIPPSEAFLRYLYYERGHDFTLGGRVFAQAEGFGRECTEVRELTDQDELD